MNRPESELETHATGPAAGEFELINWIRRQSPSRGWLSCGIGDDCAVIAPAAQRPLLITKDMLLEGRHFDRATATIEQIGYKCLAVNLSDIAAMAGQPLAVWVAVALPRIDTAAVARGLIEGMRPLLDCYGVELAGGDTNVWDGPLVISVTLMGEATGIKPVLRSGAEPGDVVGVTGPLGGSLRGRHLAPQPRIREAQALHQLVDLHALIDLSDGLSSDLGHILDESGGLGATLDENAIPIHDDALAATGDGRSALAHALDDGEDFELCAVVSPADAARLAAQPPEGVVFTAVGRIEREPGLRLKGRDGAVRPWSTRGFDHFESRQP